MTQPKRGLLSLLIGPYASYLIKLKPLILLTTFLFAACLAMGFTLGNRLPTEALDSTLSGLPDPRQMSLIELLAFIFLNNAGKSLLFMLGGLLLGVFPLIFVSINGFIIGWFSYELSSRRGLILPLLGLAPHGVLEIPAILVSMAMGMGLGYTLLNKLRGRDGMGAELGYALRFFLSRITPVLFLAAVIEVTVTPLLLSLLR